MVQLKLNRKIAKLKPTFFLHALKILGLEDTKDRAEIFMRTACWDTS